MFWLQQLTETGMESVHNTYSSHWALFFALFCYGVCTQNGACFNPDDPRIQSWKLKKPRYTPRHLVNRFWKKWWLRGRSFPSFMGIAYDFRGFELMHRFFFALAESIFVMDCRRFIWFHGHVDGIQNSHGISIQLLHVLWNVSKRNHGRKQFQALPFVTFWGVFFVTFSEVNRDLRLGYQKVT